MSDEKGKETNDTDPMWDQQLQEVLSSRLKATDEELKWLKIQRKVGEAIKLENGHWALVAVNLMEKRTAMLVEESEQENKMQQSSLDSSSDQSKLSTAVDYAELEELEERQLVLKSLQHPQHKFQKAALLLFGRNEMVTRSQIQKRSGNCLVTEEELGGVDLDFHNKVKKKSQSLVGAVFSVPSSKKRLHKELLKQTRQGLTKKRLTQSTGHSSSYVFDVDSSSGTSSTHSDRKFKPRKNKHKNNTLPYAKEQRRNLSRSIRKIAKGHMKGTYMHNGYDTVEELSEVESVSSTATLKGFPIQDETSCYVSAPSPLQASSKTPVNPEMNDKLVVDHSSSSRVATDGNHEDKLKSGTTMQRESSLEEEGSDELLSKVCSYETSQHINCLQSTYRPSLPVSQVTKSSTQIERQESTSSRSSSNGYSRSLSDSSFSMSHTTDSLITSSMNSVEDDDKNEIILEQCGLQQNEDLEIPMLPPIPNCSATFGLETTVSWLDKYSNNINPPSQKLSQTDSTNSDADSPEISDAYTCNTDASDPDFTPFVTSDIHPLSDAFIDTIYTKWKGVNVSEKAWQVPEFKKYSNTLDHEPTNDDVVVYKMLELSEEIEEKFENKLRTVITEACILALKDQLSFMSFHKLSQRLVLPVSEVKERAMLVTILGRNLWEKLPNLQAKIVAFTEQAVEECYMYSTILDAATPQDFSEIMSDYDDWTGELDTEELRRTILMENVPFMASVESLSSNGDGQLPPYPPNYVSYGEYMMIPRPRIQRSRSIEVLFVEEAAIEGELFETDILVKAKLGKFNPPRRTVSDSSFVVDDDSRKTSMCSVFGSIIEEDNSTREKINNGVDDASVIRAEDGDDAWLHLKDIERGKTDRLKGPLVLSTSSTDSSNRTHKLSHSSHYSSQDSTTSLSSTSDNEGVTINGSQSPLKGRKVSSQRFDVISEEHQLYHTNSNYVDRVKYAHITMIKPAIPVDSSDDDKTQDGFEDDLKKDPDNNTTFERRRSSAEILVDVASPVLSFAVPLAIFAALALKRS